MLPGEIIPRHEDRLHGPMVLAEKRQEKGDIPRLFGTAFALPYFNLRSALR
jgi:hypothetical protein